MANHAPVLAPAGDPRPRTLSISLAAPVGDAAPQLCPPSEFASALASAAPAKATDAASHRNSYHSDHSHRSDGDGAGDSTPRTSFSSGSCTPPKQQPLRRTSGRRPLSVISSSSANSDASPLTGADRTPADHARAGAAPGAPGTGAHGLGVSYAGHTHARGVQQTPEPYSPSKHRRHRSMISAPIDYRTQYTSPQQFGHPLYVNYTPSHDPATSPNSGYTPCSPFGLGAAYSHYPHYTHYPHYAHYGAYPSPGPSPPLDASPLAASPSLSGGQSPRNDPIQDLFVAMAYKERQVLEARQNLEEATEVLNAFKRQLKAMITPRHEPVSLPCRPAIISRRHCPNVGIHALTYTAQRPRRRAVTLQITRWRIDNEVSQALDDEMGDGDDDDDDDDDDGDADSADGIALRIVKCLLGIVHCIIATLPVHQREFAQHPQHLARHAQLVAWTAEYPLPMETLFGYLAFEA